MPSKVFSSFDIAAETYELKDSIVESRVNNIYQLNEQTLLLKLHKVDKPPLLLLLESGKRFHLTSYAREKPTAPPAFCMALRKHLRNAWLRVVEQYEFERIVTFTFETKEGTLRLVLELFGEGNLILTGNRGEIVQALVFKRMRDRNIVRGESYVFPPSSGRNPFKATQEEVETDLQDCGENEVVRALPRSLGLGGVYAEELLLRARIEKTKHCMDLATDEVVAIYAALQNLLNIVHEGKFEPQIVLGEDGSYLDVVPFQLKRYEACRVQPFMNFNEALDEFYLRVTAAETAADAGTELEGLRREANKLRRVMSEQEQALREAENRGEAEKKVGDAIYAHSYEFQALLERFNAARNAGEDLRTLTSENSDVAVESFDSKNLSINVCVDGLCFSVSLRKSMFENAAEYYERGKRAKQKASGTLTALEESRRRLADIEQRLRESEKAQLAKPAMAMEELVKRKVQGKEWFEKFRYFLSSDGFLVVAGKDSVSNEVLIKKHVEKDDVVFHAEITGAPFVVVKTEGKLPTDQVLREASEFAAAFSRAWREGLGSADVYWVKPEQLSKTGSSGEYVAHGAFFVIGKRNWMRGVSLCTAVGVAEDEGEVFFVGGPVDAVKAKSRAYITLLPGDMMGKEILRKILQSLGAKLPKELREKVIKASIERVREFVPYTKGRFAESAATR